MLVRMTGGVRNGLEQEVPVPVARTLVSDGRAVYVDEWRNGPTISTLEQEREQEQAPEHKPTHSKTKHRGPR